MLRSFIPIFRVHPERDSGCGENNNMPRISLEETGNKNLCAFLDMLAFSEIGPALLAVSDDGYNVIVGSTPSHPILFSDYSHHPMEFVKSVDSDAAGRYQILGRYAAAYARQLALPDFGPVSQDRIAIQLIHECHAAFPIQQGQFQAAVEACRSRWASLPGANYGQHENAIASLQDAFVKAGGTIGTA